MEHEDNFAQSIDNSFQLPKHDHNHQTIEYVRKSQTSLLAQANPILPNGRYMDPAFKEDILLSYYKHIQSIGNRSRLPKLKLLDKTNFQQERNSRLQQYNPNAQINGWQVTKSQWISEDANTTTRSSNIMSPATITNFNRTFRKKALSQTKKAPHEFNTFLNKENAKLVYQKLNNEALNSFSKNGDSYYSSIFFDVRDLAEAGNGRPYNLYEALNTIYPNSKCYMTFKHPTDPIEFDSDFEGGNLFAAFRVKLNMSHLFDKSLQKSDKQYDLFLQNDTNTKGSTQWFYFSVKNQHKVKLKLNILNFVTNQKFRNQHYLFRAVIAQYKESSLFNKGMKPLVYSTQRFKKNKDDWKRMGTNVVYSQGLTGQDRSYYTLSFTYEFEYADDTVYFVYSFPYGYSDLRQYLSIVKAKPSSHAILTHTVLCKTLLNLNVHMLEIGTQNSVGKTKGQQIVNTMGISQTTNFSRDSKRKEIIYIICRQHSGQSPASLVFEGILNTLLQDRPQAIALREKFAFKLVPMANPDGVLLGNYRTNLSGFDVNRKWDFPSKSFNPQIFALRKKIFQDKKDIRLFLDLHAHSRKMNSFFYSTPLDKDEHKLYPFVCSRLNKDISFEDCSYQIDESKRSTARVVCQTDLQIRKSYTFQTSFYGRLKNERRQHFQKSDLRALGEALVLGLFYAQIKMKPEQNLAATVQALHNKNSNSPSKTQNRNQESTRGHSPEKVSQKYLQMMDNLTKELQSKWKKQLKRSSMHPDDRKDSVGSDSQPEEALLKQLEMEMLRQARQQDKKEDNTAQEQDEARLFSPHKLVYEQMAQQRLTPDLNPIKKSPRRRNLSQLKELQGKSRRKHDILRYAKGESQHLLNSNHTIQQQQPKTKKPQYLSLDQKQTHNYRYGISEFKRTLKYMIDRQIDVQEFSNMSGVFPECTSQGRTNNKKPKPRTQSPESNPYKQTESRLSKFQTALAPKPLKLSSKLQKK